MIGMTRNADDIMTIVTTAESCTVGRASKLKNPVRRAARALTDARCPVSGGRSAIAIGTRTRPSPATEKNGSCHPPQRASSSPAGTPSTAATENEPITAPSALAPAFGWDDVGHDRERQRGGRAPEETGEDPGGNEAPEPRGQAAQRCGDDEPRHRDRQGLAPVEAVQKERAGDAGYRRRRGCAGA